MWVLTKHCTFWGLVTPYQSHNNDNYHVWNTNLIQMFDLWHLFEPTKQFYEVDIVLPTLQIKKHPQQHQQKTSTPVSCGHTLSQWPTWDSEHRSVWLQRLDPPSVPVVYSLEFSLLFLSLILFLVPLLSIPEHAGDSRSFAFQSTWGSVSWSGLHEGPGWMA